MFTGLINHCGEIVARETSSSTLKLWIQTKFNDLQLGDSLAVDGVCLTVVDIKNNIFVCEISPETRRLTLTNDYQQGQRVNLEKPLRFHGEVGGHLVSGHVDQTATVDRLESEGKFIAVYFKKIKTDYQSYLIPKGSVAINGVSLTVNAVFAEGFNVMLIPHTLQHTNLSALKINQAVNVEYDMLAKLVARQLQLQKRLYHEKICYY